MGMLRFAQQDIPYPTLSCHVVRRTSRPSDRDDRHGANANAMLACRLFHTKGARCRTQGTIPRSNQVYRMLYESQVVAAVCLFLKRKGFVITQRLSTREHGEDIKALAPNRTRRVTIEAKGETSSRPTSNRFGKPFDAGQVWDHVSKAVYCAARTVPGGTLAGVAFPKNDVHTKCVEKILPALKKLRIEVFWVLPNKRVEVARHWKTWN